MLKTHLYALVCKRNALMILVCCFFLTTGFLRINAQEHRKFVLVLDAGHGGSDPGTRGVFSLEKNIALDITLKVGNYIETNIPEVEVIYTRKSDVFIPLHERAQIANRHKADLFMSIHVDGVKNKEVYGTSTFVMGLHKTEENLLVAQRENAVITQEEDYENNYAGFDPSSPESYIRFSLQQFTYQDLSLTLAAAIQEEFEQKAKRKNRGVKQAGFLVLWRTTMPSVLIETGFLTHKEEEIYLNSSEGQDYIASAIYRAFRSYRSQVLSKSVDPGVIAGQPSPTLPDSAGVFFTVQVGAGKKKIPVSKFKLESVGVVTERREEEVYRYTIGSERDYEKITSLHQQVRKKVKDAFIVGYINGKRVTAKEALAELNK
jgi:N-acetylmuramoyl-L-alanine amidase